MTKNIILTQQEKRNREEKESCNRDEPKGRGHTAIETKEKMIENKGYEEF